MATNNQTVNEALKIVGTELAERKYELANKIKSDVRDSGEAVDIRAQMFQLIADGIMYGLDDTKKKVTKWGEEIGELAIQYGNGLDDSLKGTNEFRLVVWDAIEDVVKKEQYGVNTVFELARIVDPLLDEAVYAFSVAYVKSYKDTIEFSKQEFLKLSAPIVPIYNGVAVLPIIGSVDEDRAYLLLESTLHEANKKQLSHLLIDLSGVAVVDTMVASHIFKIIQSLELLGVRAILAGIRPEVAQTMVSLGIDFSEIHTYSTLQQALSIHQFSDEQ